MAHCVVLDLDNTALIRDEAVRNGETYKLMRYDGMIFLDIHTIATTQTMIQQPVQTMIQQDSSGLTISRLNYLVILYFLNTYR